MPYIDPTKRGIACVIPKDAGELNFAFTWAIGYYLESQGLCYQTINDIVGALEGAKAEFQRRVVAPYEDRKRIENGDVYDEDILGSTLGR